MDKWFEIVGVVRDIGLDPDDMGDERPFVFHTAPADAVSPFVISVRTYAYGATAVLVAATLSGLAVRRRLDHLDLVAVLKTKE